VPLSDSLRAHADNARAIRHALAGGDDYELCFTAPASQRSAIEALAAALSLPLTRIGVMTETDDVEVVDAAGQPMPVADGYEHFR